MGRFLGGIGADQPGPFPFTTVDLGIYTTSREFYARNVNDQNTSSSPITINISEIDVSSDVIPYNLSSGELVFNYSGKVYITYNVSYENTNNTRSDERFFLEKDSGSGFQLVEGSSSFVYVRTGNSDNGGSKSILLDINSGDIIRLRTQVDNGSSNIVKGGLCSIVVIDPQVCKKELLFKLDSGVYDNPDDDFDYVRNFDAGDLDV